MACGSGMERLLELLRSYRVVTSYGSVPTIEDLLARGGFPNARIISSLGFHGQMDREHDPRRSIELELLSSS